MSLGYFITKSLIQLGYFFGLVLMLGPGVIILFSGRHFVFKVESRSQLVRWNLLDRGHVVFVLVIHEASKRLCGIVGVGREYNRDVELCISMCVSILFSI